MNGTPLLRFRWLAGRFRPTSIPAKLAGLFALVIGGIAAFFFLFFPAEMGRQAEEALVGKASSIAEMASFSVRSALYFDDIDAMKEAIGGALETEDLLYVAVSDTTGKVLAVRAIEDLAQGVAHSTDAHRQAPEVHRVVLPVELNGDTIGQIHLGVSLSDLNAQVARARRIAAVMSVLIFLGGMAFVVTVSVQVTNPLRHMVATAERIADGDLSKRADVRTRDEVGHLADAFNTMVSRVQAANQQLETANRELESRVDERTRRLMESEQQLRQVQKMEAVGRLAAGVAHDFNNLLTVIGGHSDLLISDMDAAHPMRESLESISSAGQSAAALTQQLLAFSRKQVLKPKVLHLNAVLDNLSRMLARLLGEDIDLTLSLRPELSRVEADPGQIEQVVVNLAVNARDAMPQGGKLMVRTDEVELGPESVREHAGLEPGAYVVLHVEDTGSGMTQEVLAQVFDPFFTTKQAGKGTGLGLSTAYGIVKQSGGYVAVESRVGRGTCFSVFLPPTVAPSASEAISADSGPQRGGSETILLVEDSPELRALARRVLRRAGYDVADAADGQMALEVCDALNRPIDMLLTDVVMPGMNGREVADEIRLRHPDVRVLYMSGYTDDAVLLRGVSNSDVDFMEKPFSLSRLLRRVRHVLDKSADDRTTLTGSNTK